MKKGFGIWMLVCFSLLFFTDKVYAATPRVMVSDYEVKEGGVVAGEEFTLTLTLKNTAQKVVKNLKLTIYTENGELLPAEGAGTAYSEQIDADSEQNFSFKMKAINGLEEKAYKLSVKTEYENTGGFEYTVEDSLFIPVSVKNRIALTDFFTENVQVQLGDTVELTAEVNNLGDGTVYNVTAVVIGDNFEETQDFVGNIDSGKSAGIDILTKAVQVAEMDRMDNRVVVSYEDKEGNVYQEEMSFQMVVVKPEYKNLEKVKEEPDTATLFRALLRGLAVMVVIGIVILLCYRHKKHKQRLLEEFID